MFPNIIMSIAATKASLSGATIIRLCFIVIIRITTFMCSAKSHWIRGNPH